MNIEEYPARKHNILLIEDSPMDANLVKIALSRSGRNSHLSVFGRGEEALLHMREHSGGSARPDLVILDLNLPGMDGFDVLRDCKRDPRLSSIPVVVFTTTDLAPEISACYELGAERVEVKSDRLDSFLATVQSFEQGLTKN